MRRRQYLAAASMVATLGLAGCGGGTGGGNNTSGGGTEAGGTATEAANDTTARTGTEAATETEAAGTTATATATDAGTGTETTAGTETTTTGGGTTTAGNGTTETTAETGTTTSGGETTAAGTEAQSGTTAASSGGGFSQTFSGSGTSTVEGLQLSPGPVTAEFSVGSEGYYSVTLVTLEGEAYQDVFLIDGILSGEGSQVKTAAVGGGYNLNVDIDGEWELTIEQPTNLQPQSPPVAASGDGMSYVGPFGFGGPTTFQGSHSGDANYIVTAIPTDPSGMQTMIFNQLGNFEGETTARVSGTKYINVVANGEWSLTSG